MKKNPNLTNSKLSKTLSTSLLFQEFPSKNSFTLQFNYLLNEIIKTYAKLL